MNIVEIQHNFNGQPVKRSSTVGIVIHHSDTDFDAGAATIHQWHLARYDVINGQKVYWKGIGYNYVIRMDGMIETGRPIDTIGSHAGPTANGKTIGVCLSGNFEKFEPTDEQYQALAELVQYIRGTYGDIPVSGHRDWMQTDCPGSNFDFDRLNAMLVGQWEGEEQMDAVKIVVNGYPIDGHIYRDQSFAPVRQIVEMMGGSVTWDEASRTVVVQNYNGPVRVVVKGKEVPGVLSNGKSFGAIRELATALGANVRWDDANKTVFVE
ncbi:N-acetylmuramoyl-L-alanine amidase [Heliobacterium chlorum]|uniref:N-acetylmuramoyl-L-alanine amidase n=1 Tax=Heliobacterium chlorum TaxID=2698 RepID=A0ABR7SYF5_HELCL|nr:N-acetylmuramoyl-L-alanine amidase [Heliobacterium chlorum]MBC9783559.1 N-acetylmuramoyl-L-alanine amidase [Heliobacterium chlorum]